MKEISRRHWNGKQSLNAEVVVRSEYQVTLRATIRRDYYDYQSYGRVDIWTGKSWSEVLSRSIAELPADSLRAGDTASAPNPYLDKSLDLLIEAAKAIVF